MNKTYRKNILREVASTKNRFFAITIIVALGVSILVGLLITAPDMRHSADSFFDESQLMDIRVLSTLGLTDEDLDAISDTEGVHGVMGVHSAECLVNDEAGDTLAVRIQSIPDDRSTENVNYLNQLQLIDGRLPEQPGECVVLNVNLDSAAAVGDVLTLAEGNEDLSETLAQQGWTVVGTVYAPTNFSIDSETVSVGDGQADLLLYAPESAFVTDVYTTIYITVEGAADTFTYGDDYQPVIDPVVEKLEDLGVERSEIRRQQVVDEAQAELDDARAEYEDAKAEAELKLADAEAQLADAKAKLEDGEAQWEDGQAQWESGTQQLKTEKQNLSTTLTEQQKQLTEARRQLTLGKQQLSAAKKQLQSYQDQYDQALAAQTQVEEGRQQLEQAKSQLEMAQQAIDLAERLLPQLEQGVTTAQKAADLARQQADTAAADRDALLADPTIQSQLALKTQLDAVLVEYPQYATIEDLLANPPADMDEARVEEIRSQYNQYTQAQNQVDAANLRADAAEAAAQSAELALQQAQDAYDQSKTALEEGKQTLAESQKLIEENEKQLADAEAMLEQYADLLETAPALIAEGQKQIEENEAKLELSEAELESGELALSMAPGQAQLEFEQAQDKLDEAKAQLDESRAELDAGWEDYNQGEQEYQTEKEKAEQELLEAEDKLIDAQREIDKINSCEWYVLDRGTVMSYATFESNADKLASIAVVFPVFFFLVAALVALTTMTRMVDENRTQIGTLKALGYSESAITSKYLLYALAASLLGSAVGLVVGYVFFPSVIWNAYSTMYHLPKFELQMDASLTAIAVAAACLSTAAATINACHSTLAEKPAALLMPKAPKAGKRILLERVGPVWRRMKFTHKVTARNLFRYKKRFFMTVVGIAGCTALLLVGFGIQDSIMDLMNTQYQQLWHYDLAITLSDPAALEGRRGIEDILADGDRIEDSMVLYQKTMDLSAGDETVSVSATVPQTGSQLENFVTLRSRRGHDAIPFDGNSVVLTEKAAETLGVKAGDTVELDVDGAKVTFTLTGVTENYLGSSLYVGIDVWEEVTGQTPEWNQVFAKTLCTDADQRSQLSEDLLGRDDVQSAIFTADSSKVFSDAISNINNVVVVIIICAALLAVVVLYNLININIGERKKELATIKVLGFFDREVSRYIFREIDLLCAIGSLAGLALGVPLHQFVIQTVEIDEMMFIRSIEWSSYIYAFVLTLLFSQAVCLYMRRNIKAISMVESLKAPE